MTVKLLSPEKEIFLSKDSRTELDLLSRILGLRHMKSLPVFFPACPACQGTARAGCSLRAGEPVAKGDTTGSKARALPARGLTLSAFLVRLFLTTPNPSTVIGIKAKLAKFIRLVFSVWRNVHTTKHVRNYSRSSTVGRTRISRRKMADERSCQRSMPTRHVRKI